MTTLVSSKSFKLHSMDNSQLGYRDVMESGSHRMTIRNRHESCGITQQIIECSCGFVSCQHSGRGCWQDGHDKAKKHKIAGVHAILYDCWLETF